MEFLALCTLLLSADFANNTQKRQRSLGVHTYHSPTILTECDCSAYLGRVRRKNSLRTLSTNVPVAHEPKQSL